MPQGAAQRRSSRDEQPLALTLALVPGARLALVPAGDEPALPPAAAERLAAAAASRGAGHALLTLGADLVRAELPPVAAFWRSLAMRYLSRLRTLPDSEELPPVPAPDAGELQALAWSAPPMPGGEHLSSESLAALWCELDAAVRAEVAANGRGVGAVLAARDPAWTAVGRVHVHLAENRGDEEAPFAFLATYVARLSAQGRPQHRPLGEALREYAGAADRRRLLALLAPLHRAAEQCPWLARLVDSREVFTPLRWTAAEAMELLRDAPRLDQAGLALRLPAQWRAERPPRVTVGATVGSREPSRFGAEQMLDFSVALAVEGEPLTAAEAERLLAGSAGLRLIRGRWVEVDAERLRETLERFRQVERAAREQGLGFHEAMRLLAGAGAGGQPTVDAEARDWGSVAAGPWLAETLAGLRGPDGLAAVDPGSEFHASLRPYQQVGLRWLHLLSRLRLGACLADDMGLGKTVQVLALLAARKRAEGPAPSLLVAPASLLENWAREAERFAPGLRVLVAHRSRMPADELESSGPERIAGCDLVVTSYGSLHRFAWIAKQEWRLAVLDEAQAIRNAGTRQARAAKALRAQARLALTGTPIENRLGDLWSIFDFINPGLLGAAKPFAGFAKRLAEAPGGYAPLRRLVQPYLLRRLKTDRAVIADLPEKTETVAFCALSRRQAALYQQAVDELAAALAAGTEGMARKGLVLSFLMRFKQICNHASQWSGDGAWDEADSGKLARLREIAEVVAEKREKLLIFSQFAEAVAPLAAFLAGIFGRPGCVLTGKTAVGARAELVRRFQEDDATPFFALSLKAGGSGLNLTAASHVVHFDRWWNPAVEDQATDRAFRIGQRRNVLVHKFVCRGTVEERVDELIAAKRGLARELLDGAGADEVRLTELGDEELLRLVRLDLNSAAAEV